MWLACVEFSEVTGHLTRREHGGNAKAPAEVVTNYRGLPVKPGFAEKLERYPD